MSTYIKISKPAYDTMMGWTIPPYRNKAYDVLRRRGPGGGTVKVEASEEEARNLADAVAHSGHPAVQKLAKHLRNKGFWPEKTRKFHRAMAGAITSEGWGLSVPVEVKEQALSMSKKEFIAQVRKDTKARGGDVSEQAKLADEAWDLYNEDKPKGRKKVKRPSRAERAQQKRREISDIIERQQAGNPWWHLTKAEQKEAWDVPADFVMEGDFEIELPGALFRALTALPVDDENVRAMHQVRYNMWAYHRDSADSKSFDQYPEVVVDVDELAAFSALAEEVYGRERRGSKASKQALKLMRYADKEKRKL